MIEDPIEKEPSNALCRCTVAGVFFVPALLFS